MPNPIHNNNNNNCEEKEEESVGCLQISDWDDDDENETKGNEAATKGNFSFIQNDGFKDIK